MRKEYDLKSLVVKRRGLPESLKNSVLAKPEARKSRRTKAR